MNLLSGINSISTSIRELVFLYNGSNWFKIFKVSFPLSLQSIFTGLKISATLSVMGAIVGEFNGADIGLGKNLYLSAKRLEPELMMNSLLLSFLLGALLYLIVWRLEKVFGKWYLN
jgi:NitT/TauT family transport system permease protein